ncbi:MAG: NAD+ synthase [Actinomycetota bacterium]|nr:NAD+ synthase [Actinomycetota bacterium]
MKIALAQINTMVGDVWGNAEKAADALDRAADGGAELVAFPELTITGYPPQDLLLRPSFIRDNLNALGEFAEKVPEGVATAIGFADLNGDLYNACAVVSGGKILYRYYKQYLPNYSVFDENRYFHGGEGAPPILRMGHNLVGLSICEDIWYPAGPPHQQAIGGAGVLLNISASPYHRLKGDGREKMLGVRADDYGCYVVFCNLVGGQDELVFDGRSLVFDPGGRLIARAKQFEEDLLFVDVYPEESLIHHLQEPLLRKESLTRAPEAVEVLPPEPGTPIELADVPETRYRIEPQLSEEGEVLEALVLGLGDYFRKNGFSRAVIGLSGGIDSSTGAAIAARALGSENVTGVLMPSRYTSEESNTDAQAVVENLGIDTLEIPIGPAFDAYLEMLEGAFEGLPEDETEENIQARIRGNILMALSNKFGWVVVSTGNKSETSVGYSTLYGDTAGGFSVIQDVPKTLVYRVAEHINEIEGREIIPDSVLTKEPSAELRADQRDVDSLPPYDILDPILEAYVEEDKGIGEIVAAGFDEEDVTDVVKRVEAAEYKRRQSPTGIKVTPRAFGRERRMPITHRYFERQK